MRIMITGYSYENNDMEAQGIRRVYPFCSLCYRKKEKNLDYYSLGILEEEKNIGLMNSF